MAATLDLTLRSSEPRFCFGEVSYKGRTAALPMIQYHMLQALVEVSPQPLTTAELYQLWHRVPPQFVKDKTLVRIHLQGIRHRLKSGGVPITIENRRGFGYRARLD